jgi:hypothetical protein
MGPLLALAAALPIALLPAESSGVPAQGVKAATESLQRSLPAPWRAAPLDLAALEQHLAAAGPACRDDLLCLCSVVPLEEGALALDLRLSNLAPLGGWAVDLRLVVPCSGAVLDRRAAAVEPSAAALARFTAEAVALLLRGRDLGEIRWSGGAALPALQNVGAARTPQPTEAQPRPSPTSTHAVHGQPGGPGAPNR